jgi:hypothetical protein
VELVECLERGVDQLAGAKQGVSIIHDCMEPLTTPGRRERNARRCPPRAFTVSDRLTGRGAALCHAGEVDVQCMTDGVRANS